MNYSRPWMFSGLVLIAAGLAMLWQQGQPPIAQAEPPKTAEADAFAWQSLFDGKTLDGWDAPSFGGEGKVEVRDGQIILGAGSLMTGIARRGDVPRDNYELRLEAMRLDGSDFFCTTTFPVGKDYCSLVVGGWGGSVVGLSNVDYADASENSTMKLMTFKDHRWYKIRVRVSGARIEAWIDDEQVVDQPRADHAFDIRIECTQCRPLGICTWSTAGAVRDIRVRRLKPEAIPK